MTEVGSTGKKEEVVGRAQKLPVVAAVVHRLAFVVCCYAAQRQEYLVRGGEVREYELEEIVW